MQQVIIAIHLMVVTALVILVLYQKSEGGALGMGGNGVFSGRGQANALTRATGILATIFFMTSIALTVLPAWERRAAGGEDWTKAIDQGDIQFKELKPGEKAPEPGKDSIFDQLQRAQQKRQQGATGGAAPAEEKPGLRPSQEPPKAPEAAAPAAEAPKAEAPKAEAPKIDAAPKWESPKTEARPAEAPKAEAPKAEAPKAEAPKAEAPKAEAPKAEAPAPAAPAEKAAESKPAAPVQWKSPTQ